MNQNTFSIKESLSHSWMRYKEQYPVFIGITLLTLLPALVSEGLERHISFGSVEGTLAMVFYVAVMVVSMIFSLGYIYMALKGDKGEKLAWNDIVAKAHLIVPFFVASILYGLTVLGGLILLIVPGIIAAVAGTFFEYSLIDRELGPVDAIKNSWAITKGYRWKLLGFLIVVALLNLVGFLLLGFGLLISIPVTTLAIAHVYRDLEDNRSSLPVAAEPQTPVAA